SQATEMTHIDELLHGLGQSVQDGDEAARRATEVARRVLRAAVASESRTRSPFARARRARALARLGRARELPWVIRMLPGALSVVVVLAVAAVMINAADKQTHGHAGAATPGANSSRSSHHARGSAAMSPAGYFVGFLFPRSGADWAGAGQLNAFLLEVHIKAETQCMAAKRFPGPPVVGPQTADGVAGSAFGTVDLPNLPVIKRTGNVGVTSILGQTDPEKNMSTARRKAYKAALSNCAATTSTTQPLSGSDYPYKLVDRWDNIISGVSRSPAVRAANRRATACSQRTSFPASTPGREIEAIEAKLTPLNLRGQDAQATAVNASGVRVLVRCFGTVIELRDRLLAAQRVRFFAAHAHAIAQIEDQVNRVVAGDQARYGIRLSAVNPDSAPSGLGSP
ncbi:MAG: hypothetical protein ACYC0H_21840, partial [Solirubrobacteraceae bacterium]